MLRRLLSLTLVLGLLSAVACTGAGPTAPGQVGGMPTPADTDSGDS